MGPSGSEQCFGAQWLRAFCICTLFLFIWFVCISVLLIFWQIFMMMYIILLFCMWIAIPVILVVTIFVAAAVTDSSAAYGSLSSYNSTTAQLNVNAANNAVRWELYNQTKAKCHCKPFKLETRFRVYWFILKNIVAFIQGKAWLSITTHC